MLELSFDKSFVGKKNVLNKKILFSIEGSIQSNINLIFISFSRFNSLVFFLSYGYTYLQV